MYKRINKQTGQVVYGKWNEICDLDKRLWSEPELYSFPVKQDAPLAWVLMEWDEGYIGDDGIWYEESRPYWQGIRNHQDLIGIYIHGE